MTYILAYIAGMLVTLLTIVIGIYITEPNKEDEK